MATKVTTWACSFCSRTYSRKQHALNCEVICHQREKAKAVSLMADKLFPVSHKKDHGGWTHCVKCGIVLEVEERFRVLRGLRCVGCREELFRTLPELLEKPDVRDVLVFLLRKQR